MRTVNTAPSLRRPDAVPLLALDRGERRRHGVAGRRQLGGHDGRVLGVVALGDGRLVLVPVGEQRVVLVEHQARAARSNSRNTSRTWQPYSSGDQTSGRGRSADVGRASTRCHAGGVGPDQRRDVGDVDRRRVVARTPGSAARAPRSSPCCRPGTAAGVDVVTHRADGRQTPCGQARGFHDAPGRPIVRMIVVRSTTASSGQPGGGQPIWREPAGGAGRHRADTANGGVRRSAGDGERRRRSPSLVAHSRRLTEQDGRRCSTRGGVTPSSTRSTRAASPTPTATASATCAGSSTTSTTSRRSASTSCGSRRSTARRRTTTATTSATTRTSTRCSARSPTSTS